MEDAAVRQQNEQRARLENRSAGEQRARDAEAASQTYRGGFCVPCAPGGNAPERPSSGRAYSYLSAIIGSTRIARRAGM